MSADILDVLLTLEAAYLVMACLLLLFAVCLTVYVKRKKSIKKKKKIRKAHTAGVEMYDGMDMFRRDVDRYNNILKTYPAKSNGFREEAMRLQDMNAVRYVNDTDREIEELIKKAIKHADGANSALSEEDDQGFLDMAWEFRDTVDGMQLLKNRFSSYLIEDMRGQKNTSSAGTSAAFGGNGEFFAGCDSVESANKRFKDLSKVFHPDSKNGDSDAFRELVAQFDQWKEVHRTESTA